MTTEQRRSSLVATALFLMLVLSYSSAYLTMGIFFTPLIKNFGYSHARVSALSTVAFLATALFSWPAGWLLERGRGGRSWHRHTGGRRGNQLV